MTVGTERNVRLALKDQVERIYLRLQDGNGDLVEPYSLSLQVFMGNSLQFEDTDFDAIDTNIITEADGVYYWELGDTSIDPANSTAALTEFLFIWTYQFAMGDEPLRDLQLVEMVSPSELAFLPKLKLRIDKSQKLVDETADDPCWLGYTDWMLIQYLEAGLTRINGLGAYPVWRTVDEFPGIHEALLLDAAMFEALLSQELFAIDEDINYSDSGNSFIIDHYSKISAELNSLWGRLQASVPMMKKQYLRNGSARIEFSASSLRFGLLVNAAPRGSLFRNYFFSGV